LELEGFSLHFWQANCLPLTDFSVNRKTVAKKQKAGVKAGLPQFAVESAQ
jgi:hypothetical protein